MEQQTRLKGQVEALEGILSCASSLIEDIRRSLRENGEVRDMTHTPDEAIYIMGQLVGLLCRQRKSQRAM